MKRVWTKAGPKDLWKVRAERRTGMDPIFRCTKARTLGGLKRPGHWMPYVRDGSRRFVMSCPYRNCGKCFDFRYNSKYTKDVYSRYYDCHSIRCPSCDRHLWIYLAGKFKVIPETFGAPQHAPTR